jgi:micrococcal nuclease
VKHLHLSKTILLCLILELAFLIPEGQADMLVYPSSLTVSDFAPKGLNSNDVVYLETILASASTVVSSNQSNAIELAGSVTKVVDGDTLDINGIRIRLALVDTPEIGQPGYDRAKDFVKSLCLGKKGELDVDNGQRRGDRYGREVGVVYCDGVNVNDKLMSNKMAKILTQFCDITEFSRENWTVTQCQGNR